MSELNNKILKDYLLGKQSEGISYYLRVDKRVG